MADSEFEKFVKQNEERLASFGARIGDVQSLKEDLKFLRSELDRKDSVIGELKSSIEGIAKTVNTHSENLLSHSAAVSDIKNVIDATHQDAKKGMEWLKNAISGSEATHTAVSDKVTNLGAQVTDLSPLKAALQSHKAEIIQFKQDVASKIDELKSVTKKVFDDIPTKSDLAKAFDFKATYEADKKDISSVVKKIADSVIGVKNELSTDAESKVAALKKEISDKIASIKIPDAIPAVPESRVAKIESQIESIALDAKNAFLKSSNVDMQTQLHNKKIENIQLLLKQHELSK